MMKKKCYKCGYVWETRKQPEEIKSCPRCKTRLDISRKVGVKDEQPP